MVQPTDNRTSNEMSREQPTRNTTNVTMPNEIRKSEQEEAQDIIMLENEEINKLTRIKIEPSDGNNLQGIKERYSTSPTSCFHSRHQTNDFIF